MCTQHQITTNKYTNNSPPQNDQNKCKQRLNLPTPPLFNSSAQGGGEQWKEQHFPLSLSPVLTLTTCHTVSISSTWLTSIWLHAAQSLLLNICSISLFLSSSCRLSSLTSSVLESSSSSFFNSIFLSSMISEACSLTFSLRWSLICCKKYQSDGLSSSLSSEPRDKPTIY